MRKQERKTKCEVCGKTSEYYTLDQCAICGKTMCIVCMADFGCCGQAPAVSQNDEENSIAGCFL